MGIREVDDAATRDNMFKNIYFSAKAMKYHPQITKDLKKTYGLVASAAMRAMSPEAKFLLKKAMSPYSGAMGQLRDDIATDKVAHGIHARKGLAGRIEYWNLIQDTNIDNEDAAMQALYGVKPALSLLLASRRRICILATMQTTSRR